MIQSLMFVIYVMGVVVMMGLHFLASMFATKDSPGYQFHRIFVITILWPAFLFAIIGARIVYKIRNPYSEDSE